MVKYHIKEKTNDGFDDVSDNKTKRRKSSSSSSSSYKSWLLFRQKFDDVWFFKCDDRLPRNHHHPARAVLLFRQKKVRRRLILPVWWSVCQAGMNHRDHDHHNSHIFNKRQTKLLYGTYLLFVVWKIASKLKKKVVRRVRVVSCCFWCWCVCWGVWWWRWSALLFPWIVSCSLVVALWRAPSKRFAYRSRPADGTHALLICILHVGRSWSVPHF